MLNIARKSGWAKFLYGAVLSLVACGAYAQSTTATDQTPQLRHQAQAVRHQANDAAPAVDVTGSWRGTLAAAPGDPAGAVWDEELELHQDASGNIYGTRRTTPEQKAVGWFNWSVTGAVSGNTITIQDTTLKGKGDPSSNPCTDTVTATVSADGTSIDGNWTAPETNCTGGAFSIKKLSADPSKNLGDGGRCDGGEGSAGGGGKSGTGGGGSDAGCAKKNGAPVDGDPINVSTGNYFLQEDDYVENGWLTFRRFYNSDAAVSPSNSGSQWRHSFDRSLMVMGTPASIIVLYRPDGKEEAFTKSGGTWSSELAVDRLTENDDAQGNPASYAIFIGATRRTETYDSTGKLISVVGENGQGISLTYSTTSTSTSIAPVPGLLITVTDPNGRQLKFVYYSNSKLESVTLPDGGVLGYSYSLVTGDTTEVFYPDSKNRQYFYNSSSLTSGANLPNSMTGIQDESGILYESIAYDNQGNALSSVFAGNVGATHIVHNADGSSSVTYPLGHTANLGVTTINGLVRSGTVDQPCGPDCRQPWKTRTYDANGYPTSYTDFNNVTSTTTFNAFGLLEQQVDAVGTPNQRTTVTTWDSNLRQALSERILDAQGSTVSLKGWAYSSGGDVLASCEMDTTSSSAMGYTCSASGGAPAGVRRTTYTYCTAVDTTQCPIVGLLLTEKGPRSDVNQTVTYSYYLTDTSSARHGDLKSITDALGHTVTYASYDGGGRVTRMIDQNGVVRDFTYTQRGWLQTVTIRANANGAASSSDAKTTFAYTNYGAVSSVTDADNVVIKYSYDDAHRLIKVADGSGNFILYTLDAAGNKTLAQTATSGGALTRSLTNSFNALGQLTGVIDGLHHTVLSASTSGSYDVNGNLVNSSDGLGVQRNSSYDALNRVVGILDNYNGTDAATKNTSTTYAYDALGRVEGATDPDGLSTTYDFDGLNNPKATHSPDTGTSSYVYDIAGNLTQGTDAKGNVSTLTYDALDRASSVSYTDSSQNISYGYDEPNSVTGCSSSYPLGRLTRIVEPSVTTVYCYDNRGNVVQKRQIQGTQTDTTNYSYSLASRLLSITSPSGTLTQYSRDTLGRISSVTVTPMGSTATTVASAITYLPFGPISGYTLGNGQVVTRTYDANYHVTDVVSPALNLHFARDVMGNITALGSPALETYTYDPLYRLTSVINASGAVEESYTYSKDGDRSAKTSIGGQATGSYGYQANTHWLTSVGSAARTYDPNGSTTGSSSSGEVFGYGYSTRNRLALVQRNGQTVGTYVYNGLGQRVGKAATLPSSSNERFVYDERSQLIGEYGTSSKDYIWLGDLAVAVVDGGTSGQINYVHADNLGTPRAITNQAGSSIWQWPYADNPFGEAAISGSYTYNLRFPGQYYDGESNLYHNGYRDYDPKSGRFIESDPTGLKAGLNTFAYVESAPLSHSDLLGLQDTGGVEDVDPESRNRDFADPINPPLIQPIPETLVQRQVREGTCYRPEVDPNDPAFRDGKTRYTSPLTLRYLSTSGGRWGGSSTRQQNYDIASRYIAQGYTMVGGGGYDSEEYIPPSRSGTTGGTFVDITVEKDGQITRIQTVTTLADGVTPTPSEAAAAARIRAAYPDDILILVPKVK